MQAVLKILSVLVHSSIFLNWYKASCYAALRSYLVIVLS